MSNVSIRIFQALNCDAVTGYLDDCIRYWRKRAANSVGDRNVERALHYVDAFQSVRVSLLGEMLPAVEAEE
jgi:hypothetical protein